MNNKKILVTGGCGFIGSNFINYILKNYKNNIIFNLDCLGVGSRESNVDYVNSVNGNIYEFFKWNISNPLESVNSVHCNFDYLFHFAAESHVDRSISGPEPFIQSNVMGTLQILEFAKKHNIKKVICISTDEVTGSIKKGSVKEFAKYNPSSVYSASKAASELLCNAYIKTHNLDVVITRCSNNYGPRQYREKLIPKVIYNCIHNLEIPVYDKGEQRREWSYVDDHIKDLLVVAQYGKSGEIYNVGCGYEISNIEIVNYIIEKLGQNKSLIKFIPNARLGHDFRYSINLSKLRKLKIENDLEINSIDEEYFKNKLNETIEWFKGKYNE